MLVTNLTRDKTRADICNSPHFVSKKTWPNKVLFSTHLLTPEFSVTRYLEPHLLMKVSESLLYTFKFVCSFAMLFIAIKNTCEALNTFFSHFYCGWMPQSSPSAVTNSIPRLCFRNRKDYLLVSYHLVMTFARKNPNKTGHATLSPGDENCLNMIPSHFFFILIYRMIFLGGAGGIRTHDLLDASQALSR